MEQDITKQEVHLAKLIDRLEQEADKVQKDYADKYAQLDQEEKKVCFSCCFLFYLYKIIYTTGCTIYSRILGRNIF